MDKQVDPESTGFKTGIMTEDFEDVTLRFLSSALVLAGSKLQFQLPESWSVGAVSYTAMND